MPDLLSLPIATTKTIRDTGRDEFWLQDRIVEAAETLGNLLGGNQLQLVAKERTQVSGGRLDLLFVDEDNETMYEVELQLGEADESHIIRTIEYWDREKKRWPRRSHVAVLIAERINSRFFNVLSLLSHAVPIIGIQANIVSVGGADALHLTKIVDSYEEEEVPLAQSDRSSSSDRWQKEHLAQFEAIQVIDGFIPANLKGQVPTTWHDTYVAFGIGGKHRLWVGVRANGRVNVEVQVAEEVEVTVGEIVADLPFTIRRRKEGWHWITTAKELRAQEGPLRRLSEPSFPPRP